MFDFNSGAARIDSGRVELILTFLGFSKIEFILPPELILLEARNRSL